MVVKLPLPGIVFHRIAIRASKRIRLLILVFILLPIPGARSDLTDHVASATENSQSLSLEGRPHEIERQEEETYDSKRLPVDPDDDLSLSPADALMEENDSLLIPSSIVLSTDYFGNLGEEPSLGETHYFQADLELVFDPSLGHQWNLTAIPRLRWDNGDNTTARFEFIEDSPRRPLATFQELNLSWVHDRIELILGKEVFNWSVADAYSPTDHLNPIDFLDVPTSDKIGIPAASISYFHQAFELQGVWQPWFTPSRIPLPGSDNPWLGVPGNLLETTNQAPPSAPRFDFLGADLPSHTLSNSQLGVRITTSKLMSGWDFGLTYNVGRDSVGIFQNRITSRGIESSLVYPRFQKVGGSFATVIGDWQIHGEGAYHITKDQNLDDDYIEYVVGVNRSFSQFPLPAVEETQLILEFAGMEETRSVANPNNLLGSRIFGRPFLDATVGRLTLKHSEKMQSKFSGSYDFADRGWFVEASFGYEFSDNLKATMGADFFGGPQSSFMGKWDANDRAFFSLTLTY